MTEAEATTDLNKHMPALYKDADSLSKRGQNQYVNRTRRVLVLLLATSVFGVLGAVAHSTGLFGSVGGDIAFRVAAGLSGAAFLVAGVLGAALFRDRPERIWYEARAAAESTKSMAWRYAVGGEPFRIDTVSAREAEDLFKDGLYNILSSLAELPLGAPKPGDKEITDEMRHARALSLDDRRRTYRVRRIEEQQRWYDDKNRANVNQGRSFSTWILTVEVLAALGAVAIVAIPQARIDFLGPFATLALVLGAWVQLRQYQNIASAYGVTAHELAMILGQIDEPSTEHQWSQFVEDAEGAISREHTMWQVSKGALRKALERGEPSPQPR